MIKNDLKEANVVTEKANFGLTGALAKDDLTGNMKNNVVLKWSAPLDEAMPGKYWRFYVFKDDEIIDTLYLHRQSSYLFGRDNRVCDVLLEHPSISKQHCVIQFREIETQKVIKNNDKDAFQHEEYLIVKVIKPYIMDLQSSHKTFLNGIAIDDSRYYELREKDTIKIGLSTREYVLMCGDK